MVVTLTGAGNVAASLAPALAQAGHEVRQRSSRDTIIDAEGSDVAIVCVSDDAVADVCARVTGDALVLHTAGCQPPPSGCRGGVLYPMQTFSKQRRVDFRHVPLFIETHDPGDMPLLRQLAESLSDHVTEMDSERRRALHLAAVFACNFANRCFGIADDILRREGIPFAAMLPLIRETVAKLDDLPPAEAQTGPARRGDRRVMARHAAMLQGTDRQIYELMSKSIYDKL